MGRFFGLMFLLIGIVWLVEHYSNTDLPLVPILLVIIGLYLVFKPCCWEEKKRK